MALRGPSGLCCILWAVILGHGSQAAELPPGEAHNNLTDLRTTLEAQQVSLGNLERMMEQVLSRVANLEVEKMSSDDRAADNNPKQRFGRVPLTVAESAVATRVDSWSVRSENLTAASVLNIEGVVYYHGKLWEPYWRPTSRPTSTPTLAPTPTPTLQPSLSPTELWLEGGPWTLVRRVQPGSTWHPADDHCAGTSVYGTPSTDPTAATTFSVYFANVDFDEFLFMTGDGSKWLVAQRDQVNGAYYDYASRTVEKSSLSPSPYTAGWYNRAGAAEDPWISLVDHGDATCTGQILYGGNNHGGCHATSVLPAHNGANVFIRKRLS